MNAILAPSLLSADFANLGRECKTLENAGIKWLHLDIIDGQFAPNITFGFPVISALRYLTGMFFDTHLMIENPERFYENFAKAGADLLVPHIEGMTHPQRSLFKIRDLKMRAGIALNPDTDISVLRWLLPYLDMILVMGVNPGFSGQSYLFSTLEKVRECRAYLIKHGFGNLPIEVDGGVNLVNALDLATAGATILVSGSAFFKIGNAELALSQYDNALKNARLSAFNSEALAQTLLWQHF